MLITGRTYYFSPLGVLQIETTPLGICSIQFSDMLKLAVNPYHAYLETCIQQMNEFINGNRQQFDFPIDADTQMKCGCDEQLKELLLTALKNQQKSLELRKSLNGNMLYLLPRITKQTFEEEIPKAAKMVS